MSGKTLIASLFAVGSTLLAPAGALAEDSPFRQQLLSRSSTSGLGRASLPLLARQPGAGSEHVAETLAQRLCRTDCGAATGLTGKDHLRLMGQGWELTVFGDGSAGRFRDLASQARMREAARPVEQRLPMARLEQLGRAFIRDSLSGVVELGPGEALVPFKTVYELEGVQGIHQEAARTSVLGNTIVFTRTIGGVAVVGAGSKVAVTFANDESPVSFDYDWPRYAKTGREQPLLSHPAIQERVNSFAERRTGAPAAEVQLEKLECGYFDAGVRRRDPGASIQAGCFVHMVRQHLLEPGLAQEASGEGTVTAAYAGAVPAGAVIEADARWAELSLLGLTAPGSTPVVEEPKRPGSRQPGASPSGSGRLD